MAKKCIICHEEAAFRVKGSSEFYCPECAEAQFGDVTILIKVEDDAKKLKRYLEEDLKFNIEED